MHGFSWIAIFSGIACVAIFILVEWLKTGRRRLRQAHDLLEGILVNTEDLVVAVDVDFRYLVFNGAYAEEYRRLFGAEVQIGGNLYQTLAHLPQACGMEAALWKRALRGEAFTIVDGCGEPQSSRRTFEMKFTPLRDTCGRIKAAACIARDMTARLQEERALRESEQRFRVFFNNVAVGTVQLDNDGHFIRVNDRFCLMTGYSREELLCLTPVDLLHPEDGDPREPFWRFLQGEASSYRAEKRYIRANGDVIWVEVAAGLVRDEQGYPLRTVGIIQDITERKHLEEELRSATRAAESASRAKSEFLATMSHEIRTPMTVFMVALEHLLEIDHHPQRRQFLEMADSAARRLRILIDDILDFSRIEAGRIQIEEQPFDLRQCVSHAVELFAVSARDKGLQLVTEMATAVPPRLIGDPDRIEQILINLVGNAIKFTDQGEIAIAVELGDNLLRISVTDTGVGIPEEKRDLLFRHFSQIDSSSTRKHGGTGLGLAICKGLVDLMGGQIDFESRPGEGSTFFFVLPLKTVASPGPSAGGEQPLHKAENNHPDIRILLTEDEPSVRTMIQMLLEQNGWQVDTAGNGAEAVSLWREEGYPLVFMDVRMPVMDGLEAARRIRLLEKEGCRRTCIIGLTAHADREMQKYCLEAGMDHYLAKPVRMGELFAVLEKSFSEGEPMAQGE